MDILSELVKFLQEVSPLVWQSLIKQVYSEAFSALIWGVVFLVASVFLFRFSKARLKENDTDFPAIITYIVSIVSFPVSLLLLTDAIQRFINPEYYAIRFILQGIGGG